MRNPKIKQDVHEATQRIIREVHSQSCGDKFATALGRIRREVLPHLDPRKVAGYAVALYHENHGCLFDIA
jgi:hypothetical protein